jgi:sterol desaturase/sphingolipid hydroxylase (fatty acid hydroxylase superfamily)
MPIDLSFWNKDYRLDKMSLKDLWIAYFMYPAIQVYITLAVVCGVAAIMIGTSAFNLIFSAVAVVVLYPLFWYGLHRFVLHGKYLYRSPLTAKVWKRIHFDHHRDPHDLKVLFGSLYTTLPTILVLVTPVGALIGGTSCALAAFATGCVVTCFYEFCHCIQHLKYNPKSKFLKYMKKYHLQHHFHDENHNYGITNFLPDKVFKTFHADPRGIERSETVFNLGYTKDQVKDYPWVARMTNDIDEEKAIEEGVKQRRYKKPDPVVSSEEKTPSHEEDKSNDHKDAA